MERSDWNRPYFEPHGGDPFLFFAVYGSIEQPLRPPRDEYRFDGLPNDVNVTAYQADQHPEVCDRFREGYEWDELSAANPELARRIGAADLCTIIQGDVSDPATLDYLRNTVGLITYMLDHGGIAVYDPQRLTWRDPEQWRSEVFEPGRPVPSQHAIILASEDADSSTWLHTRGMRTFGRPDLSIHHIAAEHMDAVVELLSRFIEYQALGGVIGDREEIRMDVLPEGMYCEHRGSLDDLDFNNVHVEICWPA